MKKIESKKTYVAKNSDFTYVEGHRGKIVGESKNSLRFYNKIENDSYYCWILKNVCFKKEYDLHLNIHIPNNWKTFTIEKNNGDIFECNLDEFIETMGFRKIKR